jgi:tetratricopeptide (TPR) repeat protein
MTMGMDMASSFCGDEKCGRLKAFVARAGAPLRRITGVLLLIALFALSLASPVLAQDRKYTFSTKNQKKMLKVITLLQEENDVEGAKQILESISLKSAKPYDRARILQLLGTLAAQEEDFPKALEYLEGSVAENAMQPEEQLRTLYLVGQLQTMLERYDEAIVTLESWISQVENPAPGTYYTLAVTYYQANRPGDAIEAAKKAVQLSDEPREAWYRLLLSLHLERQEYPEALALLDDIILKFPDKAYWNQLAAVYSQLDDMSKSLAVQQLANMEGYVTEDRDLTRLAQMLMVEGLPHRGAEVMQQGLEDGSIAPTEAAYRTLSDTLLQSREWELALEPLEKAAEMHDDGSLFVRLAQVNLQLGRWADARTSLNQAFEKGELADEGQAHILFGIAAANDKKWDTAISAFQRAGKYEGTANVADKWVDYVKRERIRLGDN